MTQKIRIPLAVVIVRQTKSGQCELCRIVKTTDKLSLFRFNQTQTRLRIFKIKKTIQNLFQKWRIRFRFGDFDGKYGMLITRYVTQNSKHNKK